MSVRKYNVGFRTCNKLGDWFEIIEYNNPKDVLIRFDNGEELNIFSSRIRTLTDCNILPPSKKNNNRKCERHGDRYTKLWKEWNTILWRCNPKNKRHHVWYSDNGIKVCEEWMSYLAFKEWALNNGFEEYLTIDRIDSTKDYCPKNCRWLTQADNVRNIQTSKSWKPVLKYDLDGNFIERYKNLSQAFKSINIKRSSQIEKCCEGKIENYKGFVWKYENK